MCLNHLNWNEKTIVLFLLVVVSSASYSQTIIKGTVTTVDSKSPVKDVIVSISEIGGVVMKTYTMSDKKGEYQLKYEGAPDSIVISASGFNVKKQSKVIPNVNSVVDFSLETNDIVLKEVRIIPPKIKQTGDTINYRVSAFADATDHSIGDVLKKLPGIRISDDGTVFYQNLPINKYYIENLDLLQGRYGIANNNIKASDISTVQIFENHQPVKVLQGIDFSDRAAINLKLKESAKEIFFADLTAGVGLPALLLNNSIIGMRFSRTVQDLVMYKEDNTGRNISDELKSYYNNETEALHNPQLLNVQMSSPPAIRQQRFLFNNAHLGSVNDLRKLNKDYTFTTNINYAYDEPKQTSSSTTEYFLPEQTVLKIDEHLQSVQVQNKLHTDFLLNANNENFYLNNNLKLEGNWNKIFGEALTSGDTITQRLRSPAYSVGNNFDWIKKAGKRHFEIHSFAGYNRMSQSLVIVPWLYEDIFPEINRDGKPEQNLHQSGFITRNRIDFGQNRFNLSLNFNAELQNMKTDLFSQKGQSTKNTMDSLRNNLQWNRFEWELHNFYSFDLSPKISMYFGIPLRYVWLYRNNRILNKKSDSGFFYVEPFLHINYQITPAWSALYMYGITNNTGGISDAYTSYIMTSYKDFVKNDGNLYKERLQNILLILSYKNPFSTLFGNISATYAHSNINLLDDYIFQGILKIKSSIEQPYTKELFSTAVSIGKDIETIRSKLSLNATYANSRSAMISQTVFTNYRSDIFSVSPYFTTQFGNFAILNYELKYSFIKSKIYLATQDLPVIQTFFQLAKINFIPVKKLSLSFSVEHYYNNSILSAGRSMVFGDTGIKYNYKGIDFMLDYTNIFNAKKYIYISYSDISRYYYSYNLRPSEVLLRIRYTIK